VNMRVLVGAHNSSRRGVRTTGQSLSGSDEYVQEFPEILWHEVPGSALTRFHPRWYGSRWRLGFRRARAELAYRLISELDHADPVVASVLQRPALEVPRCHNDGLVRSTGVDLRVQFLKIAPLHPAAALRIDEDDEQACRRRQSDAENDVHLVRPVTAAQDFIELGRAARMLLDPARCELVNGAFVLGRRQIHIER
jgi:hypothetical protein